MKISWKNNLNYTLSERTVYGKKIKKRYTGPVIEFEKDFINILIMTRFKLDNEAFGLVGVIKNINDKIWSEITLFYDNNKERTPWRYVYYAPIYEKKSKILPIDFLKNIFDELNNNNTCSSWDLPSNARKGH